MTKRVQKLVAFVFTEAEKVIGWARNHYLASSPDPLVKGGRLSLPRERYAWLWLYLLGL